MCRSCQTVDKKDSHRAVKSGVKFLLEKRKIEKSKSDKSENELLEEEILFHLAIFLRFMHEK